MTHAGAPHKGRFEGIFRNIVNARRAHRPLRRGIVDFMANDKPHPEHGNGRVVRFRYRRSEELRDSAPAEAPDDDLAQYQHRSGGDDYRHRMLTNAIAFVFIIALIGAGLWLADTMARMRKNQDCVLSGRRGCSPVEVDRPRW